MVPRFVSVDLKWPFRDRTSPHAKGPGEPRATNRYLVHLLFPSTALKCPNLTSAASLQVHV